jgi:GTP-binding protein
MIDANEELEAGRKLFATECTFMLGVAHLQQLPMTTTPEIALTGRSNVGKSKLVNALTGRKSIARTSVTPGRTQQLNFFNLGNRLLIVDLPGYGYANAPKNEVDAWTQLVKQYLMGRAQLRRVCMLIDIRHGLKDSDRRIMKELDQAAVNYQIVLTKADKVTAKQIKKVTENVSKEASKHVAAHPKIVITSALKGTGISELRAALSQLSSNS